MCSAALSYQGNPGILGTLEGFHLHPSYTTKVAAYSVSLWKLVEGLKPSLTPQESLASRVTVAQLYVLKSHNQGGGLSPCSQQPAATLSSSDAVGPTKKDCSTSLCWDPLIFTWQHCPAINPTQGPWCEGRKQKRKVQYEAQQKWLVVILTWTHGLTTIYAAFSMAVCWSSLSVTPLRKSQGKCFLVPRRRLFPVFLPYLWYSLQHIEKGRGG